ncbi:RNA repair, ligase-Pnkp-associating, region of Hen1 [Rubinisphaera italica]|uniref:RNA repair, ligase-Pnkp-associating, region of Hen1 n=2 Tax=Rubinisphaera italica TaxID=2527969 RepID=A0A5C5X946_9PLAN|nr:RNA repair, ligase-Pnkp-associating, region of Hen1 [Rubinisphaera italica]
MHGFWFRTVRVAISKVFRSAMSGICNDRPELAQTELPLTARIDVLPVRGADLQLFDQWYSELALIV